MAITWILSCDHEAQATDADLERIAEAAAAGRPVPYPTRPRMCSVCGRARNVVGGSSTNSVESY